MSRKPLGQEVSEEEILETAKKYFSMYGYERTNLNDIAGELNITRTPIYYYFGNKLGLYEAVTMKYLRHKLESYTNLFATDLPFFEKIRKDLLMSSHFRISEHELFTGVDTTPQLQKVKDYRAQIMRDIHEMKTKNIHQAIEDRILRPDTDVEIFMVYFYVVSFGIEAVDKQVEYDMTEERIETLIDTVLSAMIMRYQAL